MRICYVAVDVALPYFRGGATHVYEVAKNLVKRGNVVHVISRRLYWRQPKHELLEGIHVHRLFRSILFPLPCSSYMQTNEREAIPKIWKSLYEFYLHSLFLIYAAYVTANVVRRYDLELIFERETSFGAGALAAIITGRPLVLEVIGPKFSSLSAVRAKKILAYKKTDKLARFSEEKLVLVSAAADTENFRPDIGRDEIRKKYGLEKNRVIAYVGSFASWHGINDLIRASKYIVKVVPEVRFLMVGPYFEEAKRRVEQLDLSKVFIFTGPVSYKSVPKYINAGDILVAPYNPKNTEDFVYSPLKLFEYMACGKAVITTNVGVIPEIIKNGKTGILVPSGDPNRLAEAVIRLIREEELAISIGMEARAFVEEQHSWGNFAKHLMMVLEEAKGAS